MLMIAYIAIAFIIGLLIGFLITKLANENKYRNEKEESKNSYLQLDKSLIEYRASTETNLKVLNEKIDEKDKEIFSLKETIETGNRELLTKNQEIAIKNATIDSINEKLNTQKEEIEKLEQKFSAEFENLANKILETKSEKFTQLNKENIQAILNPLSKNIEEFKKTVNDTYDKESKERFSLGEKVKELAQLNQTISEDAKNLTKALKGESKTQGRWGEMILETILEKSGLRKGEEYFLEYQLTDDEGNPLRSDSEHKKMRPDAIIKYPDKRTVIIDSKVSLNAFIRFTSSDDVEEQKTALNEHVQAVKNHIISLSTKGYDDYNKTLDFVMMFIPSEPAYMAVLQGDPEIWSFAYEKRILLINPTNLIIALKLIADLWKREYQNKNAQEIADRGSKLYDKFVTFVASLNDIGNNIEKAQKSYQESNKLLTTGNDNLILQATKLKNLGIKNKKELPVEIVENQEIKMIESD